MVYHFECLEKEKNPVVIDGAYNFFVADGNGFISEGVFISSEN